MIDSEQSARQLLAARDAARWLMLLQSTDLSTEDRARFIDWLRESPKHVAEMLHACRLHRDLKAFTKWEEIAASENRPSADLVRLFPRDGTGDTCAVQKSRGHRRPLLLAAAMVIVGIVSAILAIVLGPTTVRTQLGESRVVILVDGSVVALAPGSGVSVRYDRHQRLVTLEGGQVLFHVAKNAARPFLVVAGNTQVRAVGTAFSVERDSSGVSVTVVEGKVTVTERPPPVRPNNSRRETSLTEVSLEPNEQVVVPGAGGALSVRQVRAEAVVAWASGEIVFDAEPIAEVASRFNRYNRIQIRVLDPTLAARKVSGSFSANDPQSFAAFIKSEVNPRVRQESDVILLGATPARP